MENSKQVEIIKEVLKLEKKIDKLNKDLSTLQSMQFSTVPNPPVREVVKRVYPEITPQKKMSKAVILTGPIGAYAYHKQKKDEIERIRNSEEYKAQCAEADRKFDQMQAEKDKEYETAKKQYDTVILPQYQKELEQWTLEKEEKISNAEQKLEEFNKTLADIYDTTKIVPIKYRTIDALQHVYDIISTSNFDVTYALEDYNKEQQRLLDEEKIRLEEARLYEQQLANDLAAEGNQIADKARKQNNLGSIVGTVQRHNTNKILKNWGDKK